MKKGSAGDIFRRVFALMGAVVLFSFYVITLISACMATKYTQDLFKMSLLMTMIVPIMIYAYSVICRVVSGKISTDDMTEKMEDVYDEDEEDEIRKLEKEDEKEDF